MIALTFWTVLLPFCSMQNALFVIRNQTCHTLYVGIGLSKWICAGEDGLSHQDKNQRALCRLHLKGASPTKTKINEPYVAFIWRAQKFRCESAVGVSSFIIMIRDVAWIRIHLSSFKWYMTRKHHYFVLLRAFLNQHFFTEHVIETMALKEVWDFFEGF
jgi:hypothetical protein